MQPQPQYDTTPHSLPLPLPLPLPLLETGFGFGFEFEADAVTVRVPAEAKAPAVDDAAKAEAEAESEAKAVDAICAMVFLYYALVAREAVWMRNAVFSDTHWAIVRQRKSLLAVLDFAARTDTPLAATLARCPFWCSGDAMRRSVRACFLDDGETPDADLDAEHDAAQSHVAQLCSVVHATPTLRLPSALVMPALVAVAIPGV
jgi:hypothetical protein